MPVSRVIFNGKTIIDISSDTVSKEKLLVNETAHQFDGEMIVGEAASRGNGRFTVDENGIIHILNFSDFVISS